MTERELSRNAARRLASIRHAQEVTGTGTTGSPGSASTSGYAGTRSWARKACATGPPAARNPEGDQKRRWSAKIVYLRRYYHFGPHRIAMYLKRYHEIVVSPPGSGGSSNAWR
jgi:hypothetical protein